MHEGSGREEGFIADGISDAEQVVAWSSREMDVDVIGGKRSKRRFPV
jgi:hypothetical protein